MNYSRIYFIIWLITFTCELPRALASDHVFWFGESTATMKSRELSGKYVLSNGIFLCKPYTMSAFVVAFVRGGRCYILHSDMRRHQIGQLPIANGDRFFLFRDKEDLKALGLPILEGAAAIQALIENEKPEHK